MTDTSIYIGLMSGTSADSIDVALVQFNNSTITLLNSHEHPLKPHLRQQILQLSLPGNDEIDQMGLLDRQLGLEFSEACNQLIESTGTQREHICAIGCHGQTIRHRPYTDADTPHAFTLQIGDPNTIAESTKITTVSDFRRRDIAAGGQGAPLAPAFHHAAFHSDNSNRAIVNIGGMANVSYLPKQGDVIGFDTGPGNVLLDAWISKHQQKNYDRDGAWSSTGQCITPLLQQFLEHPFFAQQPPKSTGREAFNLNWLEQQLEHYGKAITSEDVQATLLELTATSISRDILELSSGEDLEVYICGGGAYNTQLMMRMASLLEDSLVDTTQALGLAPEWVEAVAFSWLAKQTLERKPGNLPAVTGANHPVTLGGVYFS